MRSFFARWSFILGSTLIVWAVSERVFWSMWRPGDMVAESIVTFLFYVLATYVTITAISYFKIVTVAGMVLIGALYGWIIEGVIAMTTFGLGGIPLPFSLSWTALAWHMPFAIIGLWWWHHRVLVHDFKQSLLLSTYLGLGWGLWSMTWFFEAEPIVTTITAYAVHSVVVTVLMIVGHVLMSRGSTSWQAPLLEQIIMFGVLMAFFVFITVPTIWYSAIVLPLLGIILYIPLKKNQRQQICAQVVLDLSETVPFGNLATLLVTPLIATIVYAMMLSNVIPLFPINYGVLFIMTTLGFWWFGQAWLRIYYNRS